MKFLLRLKPDGDLRVELSGGSRPSCNGGNICPSAVALMFDLSQPLTSADALADS
jgi:hypothetical protein